MIEVPKQAARPPSEDEDDDEDSSERPKGDRKEPMSHKGGHFIFWALCLGQWRFLQVSFDANVTCATSSCCFLHHMK